MNMLDKAISIISPARALKRTQARIHLNVLNQGYGNHGASVEKKSLKGWSIASGSALEDIEQNVDVLRKRSRDLFMGAPIATGALRSTVTNVVGQGLRLNSRIDYEYLNMTPEEADAWETITEREFALWSESVNCDITRMNNFNELQQLVFLSQLMSGDVFVTLPMVERMNTPYELCLQILEADRICNPQNLYSLDQKIVNGVEIDFKGEVVAYHVAHYHPSSSMATQNKWTRIEKFGKKTGRPNILHLMEMERPEQRRGVPILSPVFESLKQLARYSEAELMAAVISGMYTIFITAKTPENSGDFQGINHSELLDPEDEGAVEIGNGLVNYLNEGESIQDSNPGRPNAAFDGFVTSVCRQIGAALEIPYEVLMKHFTSSYSASRGALLEAWKMYKRRRDWLANDFCQPVYEAFLTEAVARGRVNAPGFFDDPLIRKAYCGAEWNGPTQGQLDPKKEVEAAILRVEAGFSTRTRETTELTGGNYFANHTLRVMEEEARRAAGFAAPVNININSDNKNNNDEEESTD